MPEIHFLIGGHQGDDIEAKLVNSFAAPTLFRTYQPSPQCAATCGKDEKIHLEFITEASSALAAEQCQTRKKENETGT